MDQAHDCDAHSPLLAAAPSPALSKLGSHDAAADIAYLDLAQAPPNEALEIGQANMLKRRYTLTGQSTYLLGHSRWRILLEVGQVQVMGGTNGGIKKKEKICSSYEYDGADGWPSLLGSPLRAVLSRTASPDGDMTIPKLATHLHYACVCASTHTHTHTHTVPHTHTHTHTHTYTGDCPAPRLPSRSNPDHQRCLTSLDRELMKKVFFSLRSVETNIFSSVQKKET